MEIKNKIINYFAALPEKNEPPKIFKAPVTMNSETALQLLKKQVEGQGGKLKARVLLHVCYDYDSGRIYVINSKEFLKDRYEFLLTHVKERIVKNYGSYSDDLIILGSPFSSLRVRSLDSFKHAKSTIEKCAGSKDFAHIPILEINLDRMPKVTKAIPERYKAGMLLGGYVSPSDVKGMHIYDEIDINGKRKETPDLLISQKAPFIFINTASNPSAPEKEWHVLNGYRQYLNDRAVFGDDVNEDVAEFFNFAVKRFLYLGWTFEDVCNLFMNNVEDFMSAVVAIGQLQYIANELEQDGYANPASIPYYITFKIDANSFPIDLSTMVVDGKFSADRQIASLRIIDYDQTTGYVVMETPIYMSEEKWRTLFRARTEPLVTRYNPNTNTIDVKSSETSYSSLYNSKGRLRNQLRKLRVLSTYEAYKIDPDKKENKEKIKFRSDKNTRSSNVNDQQTFHLRKVSDYCHAADQIKKLAEKHKVDFNDVPVFIGPIQQIFGAGVSGGFMSEKAFKDSKMEIPFELADGIKTSPPLIAIDSASKPSPAEQAAVLIHEYSHNIYNILHPEYEHKYNKDPKLKERDNNMYWYLYLTCPDERQAHSEEIKFEVKSGKSIDELIRDKVGGQVTPENYGIALKFKQLIDEVVLEIEQEE